MTTTKPTTDVIGGFPYASPDCKGCGQLLTIENAWMADGCPCNSSLGVNSMNETRWRLLMQLQQQGHSRNRFHDARRLRLELTKLIGPQDAEVAADIEALLQKELERV